MRIIDLLDAPTARDVILTHRHLYLRVVRQVARGLHQPLPEGTLPDQHGTIHILQGARDNLGGRRRPAINQHCQRHYRIQRLHGSTIHPVPLLDFPFRGQHLAPFRHEHPDYLHRPFQDAAAIAPQIQYQRLNPMVPFQIQERLLHLLRALDSERFQVNVPDAVVPRAIIRDLRRDNLLPGNLHLPGLLLARTLDCQYHLRIGHPFQQFADPLVARPRHIGRVNGQDQVARLQARQVRRHALDRLGDHHMAIVVPLAYQRSDAAVLAGGHQVQLLHILLRVILRVRIQPAQHGVDAAAHAFLHIHGIHVEHLYLFQQRIKYIEVLAHLKPIILLRPSRRPSYHQEQAACGDHSRPLNQSMHTFLC